MKRTHNQISSKGQNQGHAQEAAKRLKQGGLEKFVSHSGAKVASSGDMGGMMNLANLLASGGKAKRQDNSDVAMQNGDGNDNQIEETVSAQATSLAQLYKDNKVFFDKITSKEFQTRDLPLRCKKQLFGGNSNNHGEQNLMKDATTKLDCFEADWFKGKKVLDIGSGDGVLDILIASRYNPKLLIGVEIDQRLSTKSVKNMQDFINKEESMNLIKEELKKQDVPKQNVEMDDDQQDLDPFKNKINELVQRVKDLPPSMQVSFQNETQLNANDQKMAQNLVSSAKDDKVSQKNLKQFLYSKVSFRAENFVANIQPNQNTLLKNEKFDTILCLSTKYIHLNFGDLGINALFLRAHHQLEQGGLFILESQDWKSYKREKSKCAQFKEMVESVIKLKPGLFQRYLEAIGFELVKKIDLNQNENNDGGENREAKNKKLVYVFKKQ